MTNDISPEDALKAIEHAKAIVGGVFSALNISTVVFVDDEHEADVKDALPRISGLIKKWIDDGSDELKMLEGHIEFRAPDDVWKNQIKAKILQRSEDQDAFIEKLMELASVGDHVLQIHNLLKKIIPVPENLHVLLPEQWRDQKDALLSGATETDKILILFDHELGGVQGNSASKGTALIKDIQDHIGEKVICALISHSIQLGDEVSKWGALASEAGLERNTFFPIAKLSANDVIKFSMAIKKVALNFYCGSMNNALITALESATKVAKGQLLDIDPYDYDWMVLRSSLGEGVAEVQTLLRIFAVFQSDQFFSNFWAADTASNFQKAVGIARTLSSAEEDVRDDHPGIRHGIRRLEVVDPNIVSVNKSFQPIQCGDVFHLNNEAEKDFVLLGQSCDLIIRKDGKRSNQSAGRLCVLVPIRKMKKSEIGGADDTRSLMRLERYYSDNEFHTAVIDFAKAKQVDSNVLDLAGMSPDGKCIINVDDAIEKPSHLHAGWLKRTEILERSFKKKATEIDQIVNELKSDYLKKNSIINACHIGPGWNSERVLYEKRVFDFGLQRVERIRPAQANQILTAYGAYQVRPGEGHDYAKDGFAKDGLIKKISAAPTVAKAAVG